MPTAVIAPRIVVRDGRRSKKIPSRTGPPRLQQSYAALRARTRKRAKELTAIFSLGRFFRSKSLGFARRSFARFARMRAEAHSRPVGCGDAKGVRNICGDRKPYRRQQSNV